MKKIVLSILLILVGSALAFSGITTPGLWPWQLPACIIGGAMTGISIPLFIKTILEDENTW